MGERSPLSRPPIDPSYVDLLFFCFPELLQLPCCSCVALGHFLLWVSLQLTFPTTLLNSAWLAELLVLSHVQAQSHRGDCSVSVSPHKRAASPCLPQSTSKLQCASAFTDGRAFDRPLCVLPFPFFPALVDFSSTGKLLHTALHLAVVLKKVPLCWSTAFFSCLISLTDDLWISPDTFKAEIPSKNTRKNRVYI